MIVHENLEDPTDHIISIYTKDYKEFADDQYRKGFTDCFKALHNLDLRVFNLSNKTIGALRRNGIERISDLFDLDRDEIKSISGINSRCLGEIEDIFDEFGVPI